MSNGQDGGPGGRLIRLVWRRPADTLAERTRRRVTIYLIPFLFCLYILAYLDRVNISVAQLAMEESPSQGGLGFDRETTGLAAGIFFWGYWILEIPSTVSVVRLGARWVFARILILWGICAALVGMIGTPFVHQLFAWLPVISGDSAAPGLLAGVVRFVNGLPDDPKYQLYFFRFMLGFFEGGFFPSVIVYLSHWFRSEDRAKAIASFMAAIPLSLVLGVPISGMLLGVNWFGLPGWRWIFLLEGIAPAIAGFVTLFYLPDLPSKTKWLPAEERDWLAAELEREHKLKLGLGHAAWVRHLGAVLLLTGVYFCSNLTSYGLTMFMPAIIKSQSGVSSRAASFLAALPYFVGMVVMLVNGWHSDRTGERPWHAAVPLALVSAGIWLTAMFDGVPPVPLIIITFGIGAFLFAHLPAFWPMPTMFLGATAAASAIGFINMIGNLGGSVGPYLVGKEATGQTSFASALRIIAPWPLVAAALILLAGYTHRKARAK
jgi:MFS transporter, ACS family, tartrate transporter